MSATADEWILIGRIASAFGVHGELKVESLTDVPDRFARLDAVYVGDRYQEYRVLSARQHKHILVRLEGIDSPEAARWLHGKDIWIRQSEAVELPEGKFFVDDIIGLTVITDTGQPIGRVQELLATGANDVYVVKGENRELLIPAIHDVVREIDLEAGTIVIHVMDGLLD